MEKTIIKNKGVKITIGVGLMLASLIIIFYGGLLLVVSILQTEKSISLSDGITKSVIGLVMVIASIISIFYSIKIIRRKNG